RYRVGNPTATHLRIRLTTEPSQWIPPSRRGEHRLSLSFVLALAKEKQISAFSWSPRMEGATGQPEATRTDDSALLRPVELPLQLLKEVGGARPDPDRTTRFPTDALLTLGGLADVLHRSTGLQLMTDGFIRARLDATRIATAPGRPRPLVEVLDLVAADLDYTW